MPKIDSDPLPEWADCSRAVHAGKATALQRFLFDHQPSEAEAATAFRRGLAALIDRQQVTAPPTIAPSEQVVVQLEWIRLGRYCELSGDTPDAVRARRRKRQWIDGKESKVGPDGNLWVSPAGVNTWIEGAATRSTLLGAPIVKRPRATR